MKRSIIFLVSLSLFMLIGCGGKYCHSYKNSSDFEKDKYDCENVGYEKAHHFGASGNVFIILDELQRCLELKHGWYKCNES